MNYSFILLRGKLPKCRLSSVAWPLITRLIGLLPSPPPCSPSFPFANGKVGVGFNRDKWEQLERHVRGLTKLYANVYVCTGPLFLPKRDLGDGKNYVR